MKLPREEPRGPRRPRPLVSVITATRGYNQLLVDRCIPSVSRQTLLAIEHVVVSDHDDDLVAWVQQEGRDSRLRLVELGPWAQDPHLPASPGAMAYHVGTFVARGHYLAYCGDDDELLPEHCQLLFEALERAPRADFATSRVDFRVDGKHILQVGDGSLRAGHLDTISIMHAGHCLRYANWSQSGEASDYELVHAWDLAGLVHVHVDQITAVHHDGWLKRQMRGR